MQDTTRMLREALERVAPVGRHAIVIGEALRNGGLLDIPPDRDGFESFVKGPLRHAANDQLGPEVSAELVRALLFVLRPAKPNLSGTLPLAAPSTEPPSPPKVALDEGKRPHESTLAYGADRLKKQLHAAFVELEHDNQSRLEQVLTSRNYRVHTPSPAGLVALCRQRAIHVVLVGAGHHEVLASLQELGKQAPPVVFLGEKLGRRPSGVIAVFPPDVPADLLDAMDVAIRATLR